MVTELTILLDEVSENVWGERTFNVPPMPGDTIEWIRDDGVMTALIVRHRTFPIDGPIFLIYRFHSKPGQRGDSGGQIAFPL